MENWERRAEFIRNLPWTPENAEHLRNLPYVAAFETATLELTPPRGDGDRLNGNRLDQRTTAGNEQTAILPVSNPPNINGRTVTMGTTTQLASNPQHKRSTVTTSEPMANPDTNGSSTT